MSCIHFAIAYTYRDLKEIFVRDGINVKDSRVLTSLKVSPLPSLRSNWGADHVLKASIAINLAFRINFTIWSLEAQSLFNVLRELRL